MRIVELIYSLISILNGYDGFFRQSGYYDPRWLNENRWIKIPQQRSTHVNNINRAVYIKPSPSTITYHIKSSESERLFPANALSTISETLGAINTVGRYIVNMTKGVDTSSNISEDVPGAIYTISKNVLGRNVTDSIAPLVSPLVREALPGVVKQNPTTTTDNPENHSRSCTTPDGATGYCDDLSNCPQLLLNLSNLRQSLCFKSLFVPGVCCPRSLNEISSSTSTSTIPTPTTRIPLKYSSTTTRTTTVNPLGTVPPPILPIGGNLVNSQDCGQPETAKFRVVGGEESLPGRWPWMAAIFLHGNRRTEFWCGGALISAKHVLTAAHCTRDTHQRPFSPRQFTVRLGDIDLKREDEPSDPVTFKISEVRAHPRFSRVGFYNDIAVLVLDGAARKSKYVIPLCLPPPQLRKESFAGQRTTVVGWGTTYYGGKESTVQRQAVLPIWRNEDCDEAYFQPITSSFICAGYSKGGTDACQGDSGGPLMIYWDTRWIQVGIVSFGNKCGEPGYPGVYTRITEYLDWIKENTKT